MRIIGARTGVGVVFGLTVVVGMATTREASAQWSGTNPVTTSSVVGIGTASPIENAEVSGSGLVRLRVNGNGGSSVNTGIRLSADETARWSIASVETGDDVTVDYLQIYNERTGGNAITIGGGVPSISLWYPTILGGNLTPSADNSLLLGKSGARWKQVWAASGVIQTSDLRLKKNVADIKYGLPEILKLRPVTFQWNSGTDTKTSHLGLIAQEVQKVLPETVIRGEKESDPLGMEYSSLIPVLIKAVQTQQKTIDEQSARITSLERKNGMGPVAANSHVVTGGLFLLGIPAVGLAFARRGRKPRA